MMVRVLELSKLRYSISFRSENGFKAFELKAFVTLHINKLITGRGVQ